MMSKTKMHIKYLVLCLLLMGVIFLLCGKKEDNHELVNVFSTPEYSYLPKEAKNYIENVYEETGEILLTEKNKQENVPYLNPDFVYYLENSEYDYEIIPEAVVVDYVSTDNLDLSLPSSYDSRNTNGKNFVTPVRNQGGLGLCWAFSTMEVAETYLLKTNNQTYSSNSQIFSERQLDYATSNDGINDYNSIYKSLSSSGYRSLGGGGNFYIAAFALINGVSLYDTKAFKAYDQTDLTMMELQDAISYDNSLYELDSSITMGKNDDRISTDNLTSLQLQEKQSYLNTIKENILNYGGAYVSTYTDSNCYYVKDGKMVIDVYKCGNNYVNYGHAMEIIGWDDNYNYSYCADTTKHSTNLSGCSDVVQGSGVWLVRNSWGTLYPDVYLTYDSFNTGISFITGLTSKENRKWDNSYTLGSRELYTIRKQYYIRDIGLENEESLKRIKINAYSSNSVFYVQIKHTKGSKLYTVSSSLPGYVTLDIPDDIRIDSTSDILVHGSFFEDGISIFTSNVDDTPTMEYDVSYNVSSDVIRLYADTKNIPSGKEIQYKLYDSNNKDMSDKITYMYNKIAVNNINTKMTFKSSLSTGEYRIDSIYNDSVVSSIYINYVNNNGKGTKDNPYVITTPEDLYNMKNDLSAYYVLGNDIDLSSVTHEGGKYYNGVNNLGGYGWEPISNFKGTLDGKGHKIIGLYQSSSLSDGTSTESRSSGNGGLFANLEDDVTIRNLFLENFDITCHENCGFLSASYTVSSTSLTFNLNISNVAVKNSVINGMYVGASVNHIGGLIAEVSGESNAIINIDSVLIDANILSKHYSGGIFYNVNAKNLNVSNVMLIPELKSEFSDGSGSAGLAYNINIKNTIDINNIVSTINNDRVGALLIYKVIGDSNVVFNINNVNVLNENEKELFFDINITPTLNNVNKLSNVEELTNSSNYKSYNSFYSKWSFTKKNGVNRIPSLIQLDFEYSEIELNDLEIDIASLDTINIYDFISPLNLGTKRISYSVENDEIVNVLSDGKIVTLSSGTTTLHLESLYDGYVKDINILVYSSDIVYKVIYKSNGGSGIDQMKTVLYQEDYQLEKSLFTKANYTFMEWNTKSDGTGVSYKENAIINKKKEEIVNSTFTLYAIWKPNYIYKTSYNVSEENKYVDAIGYNTTGDSYISKFTLNDGYRINVDINSNSYVYTGGKTRIYNGNVLIYEFTNIVRGDINGDGVISALDYVRIKNHIMDKEKITNQYEKKAADVNYDGNISALDYVSIKNIIMGR